MLLKLALLVFSSNSSSRPETLAKLILCSESEISGLLKSMEIQFRPDRIAWFGLVKFHARAVLSTPSN
jgi:hypothetical protein